MNSETDLSQTYCGSKSYSSPEILLGQVYSPFKVREKLGRGRPQADVWSLGVIAFVIHTDLMPFKEYPNNEQIVDAQRFVFFEFHSPKGSAASTTTRTAFSRRAATTSSASCSPSPGRFEEKGGRRKKQIRPSLRQVAEHPWLAGR